MIGELCDKYKVMALEEPVIPMNPMMQKAVHDKVKLRSPAVNVSMDAGII
ncbi:MAG: hypothetical protein ACLSE4_14835 [Clostridium sp.]